MKHHVTLDQLRFHGMARALRDQLNQPDIDRLPFLDRLSLLLDCEVTDRENRSLERRLRRAKLHQTACMEGFQTDYHRLPRLLEELMVACADGGYLKILRALEKLDVLILDDWGRITLNQTQQEDLFQILDGRIQKRSTIATRQLPVERWPDIDGYPPYEYTQSGISGKSEHYLSPFWG